MRIRDALPGGDFLCCICMDSHTAANWNSSAAISVYSTRHRTFASWGDSVSQWILRLDQLASVRCERPIRPSVRENSPMDRNRKQPGLAIFLSISPQRESLPSSGGYATRLGMDNPKPLRRSLLLALLSCRFA